MKLSIIRYTFVALASLLAAAGCQTQQQMVQGQQGMAVQTDSIESGAIRYELSLSKRHRSFNERQPACNPGTFRFGLRSTALRIHGRRDWLRQAQDIHRRVSARRHRLLCCSGAAVIHTLAYARRGRVCNTRCLCNPVTIATL